MSRADEEIHWASMNRDEAIQRIMDDLGVDEITAEGILALQLGEIEGDAVLEVQD